MGDLIGDEDLSNAPASSLGLFALGLSKTTWNSIPLPLDLNVVNAPGCSLYVSLDVQFVIATDAVGNASFKLGIPNTPQLAGLRFYNQYAIGAPVNGFGVAFSNGGEGQIN
jgi:hypothetical protein